MQTTPSSAAMRDRKPILIDLALQGGGSHGAFTWGVLDRLLEEPWLRIDGISGTSAGAMNAAALAYGYSSGGSDGARAALETFWRRVSQAGQLSPIRRGPLDVLLGPGHFRRQGVDSLTHVFERGELECVNSINCRVDIVEGCLQFFNTHRGICRLIGDFERLLAEHLRG